MGFLGNYFPGLRVNALDLSPNYAASIISVVNGAGSLTGVVVPTFIGFMTPDVRPKSCLSHIILSLFIWVYSFQSSLEQWRTIFWIAFAIALVRTAVYSVWASGEIQPWNNHEINLTECRSFKNELSNNKQKTWNKANQSHCLLNSTFHSSKFINLSTNGHSYVWKNNCFLFKHLNVILWVTSVTENPNFVDR